ncbi:MAG: NADH-quinone oxidoreductase subunit NuoE [Verrucomicrobia bacterium]|nr:NADH-quinone oxidoreductase subunit NuoE [Verrucomicrobiota bacterium]
MILTPETLEKIETTIPKYPVKRSAVMTLLHFIQSEQGYISNEAVEWVAEKLEIQPINVLEVVTFFPYYRQEKLGKVHVRVCRTLSCALMGAYKLSDDLVKQLDCKMGHTKEDGSVTLEYAECLAACGTGPVVLVDEDLFEKLNQPGTVEPMVEVIKTRAQSEAAASE